MTDSYLEEIDKQIAALQRKRKIREDKLNDPEFKRICTAWQKLSDALDELEQLGEAPVETDYGNAVSISGKTFSLGPDGLRENK